VVQPCAALPVPGHGAATTENLMHARAVLIPTAAALAALATSLSTHAQGAIKPVEALIVNPTSRPVPVAVVPPAAPATAMCWIDLEIGSTSPVARNAVSLQVGQLNCTEGVSRLDVRRAVISLREFPSQNNAVHFNVIVGLGRQAQFGYVIDTPVVALSNGTPDLSLTHPVRIDKNGANFVLAEHFCSSGLPTVAANCVRTVFLIGTPVN
jgi:hypothetical protein